MGQPVKIIELAEQLIRLSGKKPYEDIDITVTGMRPGEKLFEELFYGAEALKSTAQTKIFQSEITSCHWAEAQDQFSRIKQHFNSRSEQELITLLVTLVPEYQGAYSSMASV